MAKPAKTILPVHPAADCFRLMTEEELAALAADIAENGQTDPIVLGQVGNAEQEFVIDGRNRIEACEAAGVEPKFERRKFANDDEVRAFVKSRGERRDITKGQRAMAHALLYPEAKHGGTRKKGSSLENKLENVSAARLSQARQVLRHSPELALAVRDGIVPLDEALKKIKDDQKALQSVEAMTARLRAEAPDLADLVGEDRLPVRDAIAALDQRIAEAHRQQAKATYDIETVFATLFPGEASPRDWAARIIRDVRAELWTRSDPLTGESLHACADTMHAIAVIWQEREEEARKET
jgi:ParB-like chromosome segregation protein Spo0J